MNSGGGGSPSILEPDLDLFGLDVCQDGALAQQLLPARGCGLGALSVHPFQRLHLLRRVPHVLARVHPALVVSPAAVAAPAPHRHRGRHRRRPTTTKKKRSKTHASSPRTTTSPFNSSSSTPPPQSYENLQDVKRTELLGADFDLREIGRD
jgi:hypothetical protein